MKLEITKAAFKSGTSKKTNKPYTCIELTLKGTEKFTVTKLLFFSDTEYQLLGIEKPTAG